MWFGANAVESVVVCACIIQTLQVCACYLFFFFSLGFLPCHFDSSCCCCSVTNLCLTLCNLMDCSTPGLPVLHHLPDFAQIHVNRVNDAIQPSYPLLLTSPPVLNIPSIRVFSSKSALRIRWLKYWSFNFSISPSNESELISFGIDWFDLLAVQGTLKSLPYTTI